MKLEDICSKLNEEEKKELVKLLQSDIVLISTYKVVVEFWDWDNERIKIKSLSEFQGDKRHGKVMGWYKSGAKHWEYKCQNGKFHGKHIEWYENGVKSWEIEYQNGELHGKSIEWDENGSKTYVVS